MLTTLQSLGTGPDLRLEKPVVLIGRHEECDVQLNSAKVSRRHCVIACVDGRLVIRDLGSTNGIRVNGERFEESNLNHGDELAVGNFRYRVCVGENAVSSAVQNVSTEQPIALPDSDDVKVPIAKKADE